MHLTDDAHFDVAAACRDRGRSYFHSLAQDRAVESSLGHWASVPPSPRLVVGLGDACGNVGSTCNTVLGARGGEVGCGGVAHIRNEERIHHVTGNRGNEIGKCGNATIIFHHGIVIVGAAVGPEVALEHGDLAEHRRELAESVAEEHVRVDDGDRGTVLLSRGFPVILVPPLHVARHRRHAVDLAHIFDAIGALGPLEHAQARLSEAARAPRNSCFVRAIALGLELAVGRVVERLSAVRMIGAVSARPLTAEQPTSGPCPPAILVFVFVPALLFVGTQLPSPLEDFDLERRGSGRVHGHDCDELVLGVSEGRAPCLIDDEFVLNFLRLSRVDAHKVVD